MWWRRGSSERPGSGPESVCRVCGWDDGDDFYDQTGSATYIICDCCGAEAGRDQYDARSARRYRQEWLDKGAPWFSPRDMPPDWNVEAQLQAVPASYR